MYMIRFYWFSSLVIIMPLTQGCKAWHHKSGSDATGAKILYLSFSLQKDLEIWLSPTFTRPYMVARNLTFYETHNITEPEVTLEDRKIVTKLVSSPKKWRKAYKRYAFLHVLFGPLLSLPVSRRHVFFCLTSILKRSFRILCSLEKMGAFSFWRSTL